MSIIKELVNIKLPEELRKALFYVVDKDNKLPDLKARYSTCTGNLLEADVVASFLEAIKKELKEALCQRKSIGYPCGKVSELCNHCKVFDTVFGGEGK